MSAEELKIKGKVFRFGDNVDTDQIIPARYLDTSDPAELARHCMQGVDGEFASNVRPGDIIIAGRNFGCGSSREHAPLSIKGAGVGAVVAESFARIFFRNAINIGLPIIEVSGFDSKTGQEVLIEPSKGKITNITTGGTGSFTQFPAFLSEMINAGGLMESVKRDLSERRDL